MYAYQSYSAQQFVRECVPHFFLIFFSYAHLHIHTDTCVCVCNIFIQFIHFHLSSEQKTAENVDSDSLKYADGSRFEFFDPMFSEDETENEHIDRMVSK